MNILIVGAGKVGSTLAAYLSQEDHDITIIDNDEDVIQQINDTLDVMCIKGPGAAPSVLREAGAKEADLVLATTNMDEVNMLCALTAKRLGAKYTIARIRDVAYTEDLASLQKDLAIDAVINPEYATALEISRLLRLPAAANVDTFFRGKVEMIGVRVREEDPIVGHPLSDLFGRASTLSILFSAAERKGEVIIPNGSFVPRPGDKLFVTPAPPRTCPSTCAAWGGTCPRSSPPFSLAAAASPTICPKCSCPWGCGSPWWRTTRSTAAGSLSGSPAPWSSTGTAPTRSCWPRSTLPTTTLSWPSPAGTRIT